METGRERDGAVPVAEPLGAEAARRFDAAVRAREAGDNDSAVAAFRQVLSLCADHDPLCRRAEQALADVLMEAGDAAGALALLDRLVARRPDLGPLHNQRGIALRQLGDIGAALAAFDRVLACDPDDPVGLINRVAMLTEARLYDAALSALDWGTRTFPDNRTLALRHVRLLRGVGRGAQAGEQAQAWLARHADDAGMACDLAEMLQAGGSIDAADDVITRVLAAHPDLAVAHNIAGNVRRDQGDMPAAIACYRRAVALEPDDRFLRANLVFSLQYLDGATPQTILAEARQWAARHEAPLAPPMSSLPRVPATPRSGKLRIGYVSAYFREHSASAFLLPLLGAHDRGQVEITLYADLKQDDGYTARYRSFGHRWRDCQMLDDAALANQVRADGIDVLIDTAMHMQGSRLRAFARRPAPVQITWLGYPGTTGLDCFDARLTDPWLDPPGTQDERYSEPSVRLDHCFWCYAPMRDTGDVTPLPALVRGFMTFGCLNNFHKVSPRTLDLWGRTMARVADSQLVLLCPEGAHRARVRERLGRHGVAGERVHFVPRCDQAAYFQLYGLIDLGLDTLPYAGHTTTLDALWMGVPVVSLLGDTIVGRAGLSIHSNLGLPGLVTRSEEAFIDLVAALSAERTGLAGLRAGLRQRMLASPLMDARGFAANIERIAADLFAARCGGAVLTA